MSEDKKSPATEFAQNWRKLKACARCHRLKSKCYYNDPSYNSCVRCYQARVECSLDFDPTSKNRIPRPRKKVKLINIPEFKKLASYISKLQNSTFEDENKEKVVATMVQQLSGLRNVRLQLSNFLSQIDNVIQHKDFELQRLTIADLKDSNEKQNKDALKEGSINFTNTMNTDNSIPNSNEETPTEIPTLPPLVITNQNLPIIPFERNLIQELMKLKYLTMDILIKKFKYFKEKVLPFWPMMKIPDFFNIDFMIKNKPLLLATVIVNSCITSDDLQLYNIVCYYLDMRLSYRIFILGDITIDIIQSYLLLSIWNPPPKQWGTFKHQLHLLTSLNLNLVVDMGSKCEQILIDHRNNVLNALPEDRHKLISFGDLEILRLFLMIYGSCGSMGLSLPKFKSVVWTSKHDLVGNFIYNNLIKNNPEPERTDVLIFYLSKVVSIGQEIVNQLDKPHNDIDLLNSFINDSEDKLMKLMMEYKLTDINVLQSKENRLIGLTYQQILLLLYDHLIYQNLSSSLIFYVSQNGNINENSNKFYKLSVKLMGKLILCGKKLIENFITITEETLTIPTFFIYRPMNAIISLIKAKILIKLLIHRIEYNENQMNKLNDIHHQINAKTPTVNKEDISNLDFNLRAFFNMFYRKFEKLTKGSATFEKMFTIIKKLKKLIKLVDHMLTNKATAQNEGGFNFSGKKSNDADGFRITSDLANNDLLNLLYELGKEKTIDTIEMLELSSEAKKRRRNLRKRKIRLEGEMKRAKTRDSQNRKFVEDATAMDTLNLSTNNGSETSKRSPEIENGNAQYYTVEGEEEEEKQKEAEEGDDVEEEDDDDERELEFKPNNENPEAMNNFVKELFNGNWFTDFLNNEMKSNPEYANIIQTNISDVSEYMQPENGSISTNPAFIHQNNFVSNNDLNNIAATKTPSNDNSSENLIDEEKTYLLQYFNNSLAQTTNFNQLLHFTERSNNSNEPDFSPKAIPLQNSNSAESTIDLQFWVHGEDEKANNSNKDPANMAFEF